MFRPGLRTKLLRQFDPHSLYLAYIHSMGIVGSSVYFSFLGWLFIRSWLFIYGQVKVISERGRASSKNLMLLAINTGYNLTLFSIFYGGINDHTYYEPYLNMNFFFWTALVVLAQTHDQIPDDPEEPVPSTKVLTGA